MRLMCQTGSKTWAGRYQVNQRVTHVTTRAARAVRRASPTPRSWRALHRNNCATAAIVARGAHPAGHRCARARADERGRARHLRACVDWTNETRATRAVTRAPGAPCPSWTRARHHRIRGTQLARGARCCDASNTVETSRTRYLRRILTHTHTPTGTKQSHTYHKRPIAHNIL
jgi:hypothetical protein